MFVNAGKLVSLYNNKLYYFYYNPYYDMVMKRLKNY